MENGIPPNQKQLLCHLCSKLVEAARIQNGFPPSNTGIVHIMKVWASSTINSESAVDNSSARWARCGRCEVFVKKLVALMVDWDTTDKKFDEISKSLANFRADVRNMETNASSGSLPNVDLSLLNVLMGRLNQIKGEIVGLKIKVENVVGKEIGFNMCKNWNLLNVTPEENELRRRILEAWKARQEPEMDEMEETVSPLVLQTNTGETQASETAQANPAPLTSTPIPSTSRGVTLSRNNTGLETTTMNIQPPPITVDEIHHQASTSSSATATGSSTVSTLHSPSGSPTPGSPSGMRIAGTVNGLDENADNDDDTDEEVDESTQPESLNNGVEVEVIDIADADNNEVETLREVQSNPASRFSTADLDSTEIMEQQEATSSPQLPAANVGNAKRGRGRPPSTSSRPTRKTTTSTEYSTTRSFKKAKNN